MSLQALLQELDTLKAELSKFRSLDNAKIQEALAIEYTYESNRIEGNGRTSRLVMNLILLQYGYPIANIRGDAESRLKYYDALERSREDNKTAFIELVAEAVKQTTKRLLKLVE